MSINRKLFCRVPKRASQSIELVGSVPLQLSELLSSFLLVIIHSCSANALPCWQFYLHNHLLVFNAYED